MNYERVYAQLVSKRQVTDPHPSSVFAERHHIVPRCMGGSDDISNLVRLTPEEHYVAHQLLAKMHPTVSGLWYAMERLTGFGRYATNKKYGWITRRITVARKAYRHTEKAKRAIGEKTAIALRGKSIPQDTKAKLSASLQGRASAWLSGRTLADETKSKISQKLTGRSKSAETRQRMSDAAKRRRAKAIRRPSDAGADQQAHEGS